MTISASDQRRPAARRTFDASLFYRREVRQVIYQVIVIGLLAALFWFAVSNMLANRAGKNAFGYGFFGPDSYACALTSLDYFCARAGFLNRTAGFDIALHLIDYSSTSTFGRAFAVGILNTLVVAAIGIVLATMLGFLAGMARLSSNWLIARLATVYIEIARNCPLLLQLFLWYFGVLKALPEPISRENGVVRGMSHELPGGLLLNVRGLYLPKPEWLPGSGAILWTLLAGIVAAVLLSAFARRRQMATGKRFPVLWSTLVLVAGMPILAFFLLGRPVALEYPTLGRFDLTGGVVILPEFVALLLGLVFYTGAYIAEIVRSGILAVSTGQKEAARAIGLTTGQTLRLVVIPQAMRVIIPPLTSQFLNLTKNSSLAAAIGFRELAGLADTILNQAGYEVEVISLIMAVYLTISLITSAFMNWFNKRMALVER